MNPPSAKEALALAKKVDQGIKNISDVQVVLCPPFVYIPIFHAEKFNFLLGAQNCFWQKQGAFTGEISPAMLKNLGCSHVIIGHSERKNYLSETYEVIRQKVKASLDVGLIPVVCIGEKAQGSPNAKRELELQMQILLADISRTQSSKIVLVYEPEWAISSVKGVQAATPQDCEAAISFMKEVLARKWGEASAKGIHILYGGSVRKENIREFIEKGGADGALVGAASLNAQEFVSLVKESILG